MVGLNKWNYSFASASIYSANEKLSLIPLSFKGVALNWYTEEMARGEFTNWSEFKRRLLARFGTVKRYHM